MTDNSNKTTVVDRNHPGFNKNAEPFFRIVREGLNGYVDGEHFWDVVAEDAVFEFMYHVPGFTNKIVGRDVYMDDNRFCSIIRLKDRKIVYWRDYADSLAMVGG